MGPSFFLVYIDVDDIAAKRMAFPSLGKRDKLWVCQTKEILAFRKLRPSQYPYLGI